MLLDCFTIVCAMCLSRLFLHAQYCKNHLYGVLVCLVGLTLLVVSDLLYEKDGGIAPNPLLGDALCLLGSFLYAVSNVSEESVLKINKRRGEYLGMIGLVGTFINGVQLAILEREELMKIEW